MARDSAHPVVLGILDDIPGGLGSWEIDPILELAAQDVAEATGFTRPIEWIRRTAEGLPEGTAAAAEEGLRALVDDGALAVLGPGLGDNAIVLCPLADELAIPCIQWSGSELARSDFMFHYQYGSLLDEGPLLAGYVQSIGARKVGLVVDRCAIGEQFELGFRPAAERLDLDVVVTQHPLPAADDLDDAAVALHKSGAEAIVYLGLGLSAEALAHGIRKLEWDVPVAMTTAGMWGYVRPEYARLWDGWVHSDMFTESNPHFRRLHERLAPEGGPSPEEVLFYDMGVLVLEAVAKAAPLSRRGMRSALEQVRMLPATAGRPGTVLGFGQYDHAALKGSYLVLRRWQDGVSVEVG